MVGHHVWMIVNSVTDINLFDSDRHIAESIARTYAHKTDVKIAEERSADKIVFHITWRKIVLRKPSSDETVTEMIVAHQKPVWNEPREL